eukprot:767017-Hanusia_phi.AAC.9
MRIAVRMSWPWTAWQGWRWRLRRYGIGILHAPCYASRRGEGGGGGGGGGGSAVAVVVMEQSLGEGMRENRRRRRGQEEKRGQEMGYSCRVGEGVGVCMSWGETDGRYSEV